MIYLFSQNGLRFLESVCFARTLYAFDFDGTLSPIVRNPESAKIGVSTLASLRELGELAPVAIISGRGLDDLRAKFDPSPGYLVGNHGLEGIFPKGQKLQSFRGSSLKWKRQLARVIGGARGAWSGVELEDKTYSLAIHYRKSRAKKKAKALILNAVSGLVPSARIVPGKCVINLVPAGAPHKGVALLELMRLSKTQAAFYIGDDDTDEDVFSLQDPRIFTVRVGRRVQSKAKFYVERQSEVARLLRSLVGFIDSGGMAERSK